MENLVAFGIREVKRAVAEEKERDEYSLVQDSESRNKKESHSNELSKN